MKRFYYLVGMLWMLLVLVENAIMAQNPTLYYQTVFKRQDGRIFGDGNYNVTFNLYESEAASQPFWTEVATVSVKDGVFTHYLGSVQPLVTKDFMSSVFLTLTFGNFESSPRQELSYAPYSFSASIANEVSCSGALGDVKYSLLNPQQFAEVNGDCWVPLDSRSLSSSDRLGQILGISSLPQAGGLFIRTNDYNLNNRRDPGRNTTTVNLQQDLLAAHNHSMVSSGGHRHTFRTNGAGGNDATFGLRHPRCRAVSGNSEAPESDAFRFGHTSNEFIMEQAGAHSHSIESTGGVENRPKNINLWTYVRIN
jgi:hypothetical protein